MYRVTKTFKYSTNGYEVETFEPDEYRELPPEVVRYGKAIGAIEGGSAPSDEASVETYPESGPRIGTGKAG